MANKHHKKIFFAPLASWVVFFLFWLQAGTAFAFVNYVASSANYRIVTDAITSGGLLGTSTNYSLQSSVSGLSSETSTSTFYSIKSGQLPMSSSYLAVSVPSNVPMSSAINTLGGGTSNGSAAFTVTTDSSGGYSLSIKASTAPALKSSDDSFANYSTRLSGIPDFSFRTGDAADYLGFTPEGSDVVSLYKDDGLSLCNTGSNETVDKCWDSILTTNKIVASSAMANHPSGADTTIKFRVVVGNMIHKKAGNYSATITLTALAL